MGECPGRVREARGLIPSTVESAMVVPVYNSNAQEIEAGGSEMYDDPSAHTEFEASLGSMRKKKERKK